MRRAISLTVEATIAIAVIAYFLVEGFAGNVALNVALGIIGITSAVLFFGVLFEGRGQRQ